MKFRLALTLILMAAATRLVPHPDNFTPIGAIGLFSAAYFSKRWMAIAIPFISLFLSDLFLNNVLYAQYFDGFTLITSWWIYAAFALTIGLGWLALHGRAFSPGKTALVSLATSIIFFLVTNFGHWADYNMYPKTFAGLMTCYAAGLPFLKNAILGDLFFCTVLFGIYEWSTRSASRTLAN
jgi:hypothetical protein